MNEFQLEIKETIRFFVIYEKWWLLVCGKSKPHKIMPPILKLQRIICVLKSITSNIFLYWLSHTSQSSLCIDFGIFLALRKNCTEKTDKFGSMPEFFIFINIIKY